MTHDKPAHESSTTATPIDAALRTAHDCSRAAALAVEHLEDAERTTRPTSARRSRAAALGLLHDVRLLARNALQQLATHSPAPDPLPQRVDLAIVLQQLTAFADAEATLTGCEAVRRAQAMLIMTNKAGDR
jgi:hypothetical protein